MNNKLESNINISYNTIIKNYNLNSDLKKTIKGLYDGIYPTFITSSIIILGDKSTNYLDSLNDFINKTGVYIFLNNDNVPVYIGVAGEKASKQSLKARLSLQLNGNKSNSTLAKNIKEIEELLNNTDFTYFHSDDELNKTNYKQLILDYAPKFIVIDKGILSHDNDNAKESLSLEKALIAIFNSKYNK